MRLCLGRGASPLDLPLPQAGEGDARARQALVRGITTAAQSTSIHLIVTAGVQAYQYTFVIFVSVNLQRNIT